jgi:hypothetical protein
MQKHLLRSTVGCLADGFLAHGAITLDGNGAESVKCQADSHRPCEFDIPAGISGYVLTALTGEGQGLKLRRWVTLRMQAEQELSAIPSLRGFLKARGTGWRG